MLEQQRTANIVILYADFLREEEYKIFGFIFP
jgi:hypothetical protein